MTANEFARRTTLASAALTALLAGAVGWLGGPASGAGVLVGGLLGTGNFLWLVRSVAAATAAPGPGRARIGWAVAAGARFLGLLAAAAIVLGTGWTDPMAVVLGVVVLPVAVVVTATRGARAAPEA